MTDEELVQFADFHEEYVSKYIQQADAKAGAVFAAAAGVSGYFLAKEGFLEVLKSGHGPHAAFLGWATLTALVSSAFFAFGVIAPRQAKSSGDLVFWGSVGKLASASAYATALRSETKTAFVDQRISHCYDLSSVCRRKYKALWIAIWIAALAAPLSGAALLTLPLGRGEAALGTSAIADTLSTAVEVDAKAPPADPGGKTAATSPAGLSALGDQTVAASDASLQAN